MGVQLVEHTYTFPSPVVKVHVQPPPRIHSDPNALCDPAPPALAPNACSFSPTFLFTSKNLATQRSMQTLSPLLRSPSAYRVLMHFA